MMPAEEDMDRIKLASEARIRTAVLVKEATESANRIIAASNLLLEASRKKLDEKARVPRV
jgi:hypothetical protein